MAPAHAGSLPTPIGAEIRCVLLVLGGWLLARRAAGWPHVARIAAEPRDTRPVVTTGRLHCCARAGGRRPPPGGVPLRLGWGGGRSGPDVDLAYWRDASAAASVPRAIEPPGEE